MSSDPSPSSSQGLLRVLGLVTGLAVTFGGIVSLGILRAPGEIAEQLPDPWWYMSVWIIAGASTSVFSHDVRTMPTTPGKSFLRPVSSRCNVSRCTPSDLLITMIVGAFPARV